MAKPRKARRASGELFVEPSGQLRLADKSIEQRTMEKRKVECFGMTFESDDARRAYFLDKLSQHLRDPDFRKIEGFPKAEDEDILALSDPPYYTACPNPFLRTLFQDNSSHDTRSRELGYTQAYAADLTGDKHGDFYNVHPYHTKVPPEAIVPLIRHYTKPGETILDPFAGTGMTGLAVDVCDSQPEVTMARRVILSDLSPIASFIGATYNASSSDRSALLGKFDEALATMDAQCSEDFATRHTGWRASIRDKKLAVVKNTHRGSAAHCPINYMVWSDVYQCANCGNEFVYWQAAVRLFECEVADTFKCPSCSAVLCKDSRFQKTKSATLVERVTESWLDPILRKVVKRQKRVPVLISYEYDGTRFEKWPDPEDLKLIAQTERARVPLSPQKMMFKGEQWGDTWRAGVHLGIVFAHDFFSVRVLRALNTFAEATSNDRRLWFALTACAQRLSRLNRYMPQHRDNRNREVVGPLSGTLYVPAIGLEVNPAIYIRQKRKAMEKVWNRRSTSKVFCTTQSSTDLRAIPDSSVDYIFTDPPFGDNLFYSELNFVWEWWIHCYTSPAQEAVVSDSGGKNIGSYSSLMRKVFRECFRVLKQGKWLTLEFHNSKNAVWSAIHEALLSAGFMVADVRKLDKKKGTTKQLTFANAVSQDLIISAYKPNGGLEGRFSREAGTPEGVWDFVRTHLKQLPTFVETDGEMEVIVERQNYLLFDRMVAFHIQRGASVPVSAAEFYAGLKQRFPERDRMYFVPEQIPEYDRRRLSFRRVAQLELFVTDERSAIEWLREQLSRGPRSYQDIQPAFLTELHKASHEQLPELRELLQQNFLEDTRHRWYVPDPTKQVDLERLRDRALLREFELYKTDREKKLKLFRSEAIRAGFKAAWAARDYKLIVSVAEKLPEDILHEDQTILMYYDNASMRIG